MSSVPSTELTLPLPLVRRGKVREMYAIDGTTLLMVASDRVSAFDVVLAEPVPNKGAVLTQMSAYWFRRLATVTPSHFLTATTDEILYRLPPLRQHRDAIAGRATLVRRATPIPFECVVRGYLAGSAWTEYSQGGTLAGEPLPPGLAQCAQLPGPIFSPATKADTGHDENIPFSRMQDALGADLAGHLRDTSLALYRAGAAQARQRGIIIADSKFEFGHAPDGDVVLIDELLTPDSSRFWPADRYRAGRAQLSFDKQPLRDYLAGHRDRGGWDGEPPPPRLPTEIVHATSVRYQDAYLRITGQPLSSDL
jgi:phosphoribosylaminoimidazole-succinocarboxamide synthase